MSESSEGDDPQQLGSDLPRLGQLDAAVQEFHSTAHTGDSALMRSARQASLDLSVTSPEPVFPGQPAS